MSKRFRRTVALALAVGLAVTGSAQAAASTSTAPVVARSASAPPADAGRWSTGADHWAAVDRAAPTTSFYDGSNGDGSETVAVGFEPAAVAADGLDHLGRTFFHLQLPAVAGAIVTSATVEAAQQATATCSPSPLQLWSSGPISSSTTWARQPALAKLLATATTPGQGPDCALAAGDTDVDFDVTAALGAVVRSGAKDWTVAVRAPAATETAAASRRTLSRYVTLTVSYVFPALAPIDLTPGVASRQPYAQPYQTFSAVPANPGQGPENIEFDVWTATGTRAVTEYANGSSSTFRDDPARWGVNRELVDGHYLWRARTSVGGVPGPWSGWQAITVDTVQPPAPTLVTDPPAGGLNGYSPITVGQPYTLTISDPGSEAYLYYLTPTGGPTVVVGGEDACAEQDLGFYCPKYPGGPVTLHLVGSADQFTRYQAYAYTPAGMVSPGSDWLEFLTHPDDAALAAAHVWDVTAESANPLPDSAPQTKAPLTVSPSLELGEEDLSEFGTGTTPAIAFDGATAATTTRPVVETSKSYTVGGLAQVSSGIDHDQVIFAQAAAGDGDAVSLIAGTDGQLHFCVKLAASRANVCATARMNFDVPKLVYARYDALAHTIQVSGFLPGQRVSLGTAATAVSSGPAYFGRSSVRSRPDYLTGLLFRPIAGRGVLTGGQIAQVVEAGLYP